MLPTPPPATLTEAPVPLAGGVGAERLASLLVMLMSLMGMVLLPLVSGVVTVANKLTAPPLLRTSTAILLPVGATLKLGAVPLQLTEVLLLTVGVVEGLGMDGVSANVTWEVAVASPMRKKMNLSIWMENSNATAPVVCDGLDEGVELADPAYAAL